MLKNAVDISDQIVGIDYADSVATLNLATTLRAAEYELIASDAIEDPDGASLDGNGDEVPGGDFSTAFHAGPLFVQGDLAVVASAADQFEGINDDDTYSGLVDVAVAPSGEHVAVWGASDDTRIFAQRYDAAGGPLGEAILVNETEDRVFNPHVAVDGQGNFVVSWTFAEDIQARTKIRRYDAAGTPLSDAEIVSDIHHHTLKNSVAADVDGNFVVAVGGLPGAAFRRFNSDGIPQGDWVTAASNAALDTSSTVAMNSTGEFVLAWRGPGGVFARPYSPLGIPRSEGVLVSPPSTDPFAIPIGLDIDEDGSFVVAWWDQDGDESLARRFDADGVPLGDAISVSPLFGWSYSVTIGSDGAFHVAWANAREQVVYVQQISASDERVGSELRANPGFVGLREKFIRPVASAVDAAGDLVIAWTGEAILPDRNWGTTPFVQRLVTDHAPLVDLNGGQLGVDFATDHVAGDGPVPVADPNGLFVNSSFLGVVESATVSIDGFLPGDVLDFDTTGTDVEGNFAGGVLTLTGSDSPANYGQVLRSVTFDTAAVRAASATVDVTFVVDDGELASPVATSEISNFVPGSASVAAPQLFYHGSDLDGDADSGRTAAIATDKAAYVPGSGRATFANVSSYELGINGALLDLTGTHGDISAADFAFRTGTSDALAAWTTAPPPTSASVLPGAGEGGADRVELTWDQDAIVNGWLEITIAASGRTGLAEPEVFYFGSRVGDTGERNSPVVALTTAADQIAVRANMGPGASATNPYDFDRNGTVDAADELIARANIGFLPLIEIDPPIPSAPAGPGNAVDAVLSALAVRDINAGAPPWSSAPAFLERPAPVLEAPSRLAAAAVFAGDRDAPRRNDADPPSEDSDNEDWLDWPAPADALSDGPG